MKMGVVSDTHGYYDRRLPKLLAGVDAILHAGDVGSQEVLDELSLIAPVEAVRGNVDSPELPLPTTRIVQWQGVQIEVLHILPAPQPQIERWSGQPALSKAESARRDRFLKGFHPGTRIVIFGHSHQPCLRVVETRLFVNPGSAGRKRFSLPRCCAVMELDSGGVDVKILALEDYNRSVAESVKLSLGDQAPCLH